MTAVKVSGETLVACWQNKWYYGRFTPALGVDIEMTKYPVPVLAPNPFTAHDVL